MSDNVTTEAKILLTVEGRAAEAVARIKKSLDETKKSLESLTQFKNPLDTKKLFSAETTKAIEGYSRGMKAAHSEGTRWANAELRNGAKVRTVWKGLNADLTNYLGLVKKSEAEGRKLSDAEVKAGQRTIARMTALERATAKLHGNYLSNNREKVRQERLLTEAVGRRMKVTKDAEQSLWSQRGRAYMQSVRRETTESLNAVRQRKAAEQSLWSQRGRAYMAQIRGEERAEKERKSAEQALWTQRSRAFLRDETVKARLQRQNEARLEADRESNRRAAVRHARQMASTPGRIASRADGHGYFSSPAFIAAAGITGIAAAVRKAINAATLTDTAETNARIHMDLSGSEAADLRRRTTRTGMRMGVLPQEMLSATVDAAKSGVPNEVAERFGSMSTKIAKIFGMSVAQTTDDLGYAVAQQIGTGKLKEGPDLLDKIRRMGNTAGYLASKMATRPDSMMSFMRTGMGAGDMLGLKAQDTLAFGAAATSAGAQGQQASRMLGHLAESMHELPLQAEAIQRHHGRKTPEQRLFMEIPQLLKYGSWENLTGKMKRDPTELFTLIERFGKIKDPYKRDQALTAVFGADFKRFVATMAMSPDIMKKSREHAKTAYAEEDGKDFATRGWAIFEQSFEHMLGKIASVWKSVQDQIGRAFKPFVEEFSNFFGRFGSKITKMSLDKPIQALMNGLIKGFGFDNLTALLNSFMPRGRFNTEKWSSSGEGFASGLKSAWETVKAVFSGITKALSALGFDTSSPKAIGELIGKIVGFSIALHMMRPAFSVLGFIKDGLFGLGASLMFLNTAMKIMGLGGFGAVGKRVLGGLGVRAFAGAAAGVAAEGGAAALGMGAAAVAGTVGLAVTLAAVAAGVAIGVTVLNWPQIREWFREKFGSGTEDKWQSPIEKRKENLEWWEVDPLFHRQSYQGGGSGPAGSYQSMLHKAAFNPMDDVVRNTARTAASLSSGARIQLAALGNPAVGGLAYQGGGGGGAAISGSGGGSSAAWGGGAKPKVPGWFGRGGLGGGSGGAVGGGANGMPDPGAGTGPYKGLLDHIARSEGTAGGVGGGYNVSLANGKLLPGGQEQNLKGMTLDQIDALQTGMLNHPGNKWNSSALGRYQIVRKTLRGLRSQLGLKGSDVFDENMQDRLGATLVKRRGANGSLGDEWASLRGGKLSTAIGLAQGIPTGASTSPTGRPEPASAGTGNVADRIASLRKSGAISGTECVDLVKSWTGTKDMSTRSWTRGAGAADGTLTPGTPIATFLDSQFRKSSQYAGGTGGKAGAGKDHAAIFDSYIRDGAGKAIGMNVIEQYNRTRGNQVSKQYMFGQGFGEANGSNYNAVLGPDGSALGGARSQANRLAGSETAKGVVDGFKSTGWKRAGSDPAAVAGAIGAITPSQAASGVSIKPTADDLAGQMKPFVGRPFGSPGTGGAGGGSSSGTVIHAPVTIHAGQQSPAEIAGHMQRHVSEARNFRSHDMEPELS